eukprot:gnl/TRDRNA2_/TRDRNA2_160390_c0_seq1.p1 gnl/TRDRNA2_/TRDRNA2_160390_c0~~gnl/TRDRNA2_/TRDRNA2_160390_c0_seq1.p1  ORF type:complete len:496 (+),score=84.64 gnl/TRDRNA2_/TRDRNA2_160390_c0_seq1:50-1537(+)
MVFSALRGSRGPLKTASRRFFGAPAAVTNTGGAPDIAPLASASIANNIGAADIRVLSAAISSCKKVVTVSFSDGDVSEYWGEWLLDNCSSHRQAGTGQKESNVEDFSVDNANALHAHVSPCGSSLRVDWEMPRSTPMASTPTSEFSSEWLRRFSFSSTEADKSSAQRAATSTGVARKQVPRLAYADVTRGDEGVWAWTQALVRHGVCVIEGAPTDVRVEDALGALGASQDSHELRVVEEMASKIAAPMPTLYGRGFEVRLEPNAINIAYTPSHLKLHMDLAYYESPPGLQMLHCISYDETIQGGESTFMDTFAVAEAFRVREPTHFATLCRIPATFMKDHMERANPAQMYYRRPHISVAGGDPAGQITAVFWSPPFEGPLRTTSTEDVAAYYSAYRAFAEFMKSKEVEAQWLLEFKLKPGDLVSFNQRRMLHGRNAFTLQEGQGRRHFQGCYVNIDDFLNKHRVLALRYAKDGSTDTAQPLRELDTVPRCANQTW